MAMNRNASVLLAGIGGFGHYYMEQLLSPDCPDRCRLAGVVDLHPENSRYFAELGKRGIPIYPSLESFFAQASADFTIVSTPIHYHCEQTCLALAGGSHVLCEKPVAATVQEALQMKMARDRAGKFVAIGFDLSFDPGIQALKRDISSGLFGKPRKLKTIVLWNRSEAYFRRSPWAGRIKNEQGRWILDSVAHNATSHYLHNMFYLLGDKPDRSALLSNVTAELYRANDIENYDTCAMRAFTQAGVEVLFYAAHAVLDSLGPRFRFEFENAVITYDYSQDSQTITARFNDGTKKAYEGIGQTNRKLWDCLQTVNNPDLPIPCGIEAAMAQVVCINGLQQSVPHISGFPPNKVKKDEKSGTIWVDGLSEDMLGSYDQGVLPSEAGKDWAKIGRTVDLSSFASYYG